MYFQLSASEKKEGAMKQSQRVVGYGRVLRALTLFAMMLSSPAWTGSTNAEGVIPGIASSSPSGPVVSAGVARPLISQPIDERKLVTLKGNTRAEAVPANDRGLVADEYEMQHMLIQLRRPQEREKALNQFIEELNNPKSPDYHNWLTPQQFGDFFGPAKQDIDTVTGWLRSHGFIVNVIYPSGTVVDFSGTAGQVQAAFHTRMHYLSVEGMRHIANMSDPQIPAALAPAIVGIVSLNDFRPRPAHKIRSEFTFSSGGYTYNAVVPADLATIYNLASLFSVGISGQGQTIAVVEPTNVYNAADWTIFRSTFGLSSHTSGSFVQVHPAPLSDPSNCSDPGVNSADSEAILDAEYASAAAPGASIVVASCADTATSSGLLIAFQNLVNGTNPPDIISVSYGDCEAAVGATANAFVNGMYQQAAAEGISVFVASGDQGAAFCDYGQYYAIHGIGVNFLASTPYNVAVGGTDFSDTYWGMNATYWSLANGPSYGSALSYIPEIPWNDSCASVLIAQYVGYDNTYGSDGLCSSFLASYLGLLTTFAGSGGPSGCATGTPASNGIVGGTCAGYAKPSWQSVFGNPADGVRDLPDISLFAANGLWGHYYVYCNSDPVTGLPCTGAPSGWAGGGGTSFSAPIMAGIQALVNQKAGGKQGNPNPVYYSLAASEYGAAGNSYCNSSLGSGAADSCIFYDVTIGDMNVDCTPGTPNCYAPSGTVGVLSLDTNSYKIAFGTAAGWDFATGIGTVNAYNLVNNWPRRPAKIGVFANGYWYLDSNMSWAWEGNPPDTLGIFGIGLTGAIPVVGDWNGDKTTKIGVYIDGTWYLDLNRNWQWDGEPTDKMLSFGAGLPEGVPVVGDWDGSGTTKIGIYSDGVWYLDMNGNGQWDGEPTDKIAYFGVGLTGAVPVVGDWNGSGTTKIGVYQNGYWYLDTNGNSQWDGEPMDQLGVFGIGLSNAVPVTGDWNGDGIDEIGIYQQGYWYLDKNRNWQWDGEPIDQFGVFGIGLTGAIPVPGKW